MKMSDMKISMTSEQVSEKKFDFEMQNEKQQKEFLNTIKPELSNIKNLTENDIKNYEFCSKSINFAESFIKELELQMNKFSVNGDMKSSM